MGLFRVSGRLTGPTGRTVTLTLLVDTGASLLVVPRALADELELTFDRLVVLESLLDQQEWCAEDPDPQRTRSPHDGVSP